MQDMLRRRAKNILSYDGYACVIYISVLQHVFYDILLYIFPLHIFAFI